MNRERFAAAASFLIFLATISLIVADISESGSSSSTGNSVSDINTATADLNYNGPVVGTGFPFHDTISPNNNKPIWYCKWIGTAPFCSSSCPKDWFELKQDKSGNGEFCLTGNKLLCCQAVIPDSDQQAYVQFYMHRKSTSVK